VELGGGVRGDVLTTTSLAGPPENKVVVHLPGDQKPSSFGFVDHPLKREFGCAALGLGVTPANVRVYAGKPDLFDVLLRWVGWVEWIGLVGLRLVPSIDAKHPTPFVDRNRLAKYFN
jgi:hypothetical protein